jgi:transcription antitermination factor NusG
MSKWYVAQTIPFHDRSIKFHLDLLGFRVFIPSIIEYGNRLRIYPGYVFVSFDDLDRWHQINVTPGIIKLLPMNRERPISLPEGFVEKLQSGIEKGSFSAGQAVEDALQFVPKQLVRVEDGPFWGHCGEVVRSHKGSVLLLMSLFGRPFEVAFPKHQLSIERKSDG